MVSEIAFDELWSSLIRQEYKDGGYENVRQAQIYLHRLTDQKRVAFLDELVLVAIKRAEGYGIALSVLEKESMSQHLQTICRFVTDNAQLEEKILVSFLRVLASDRTGQCLGPVETFLLQSKIGPYWNSLPWALWPSHPDLFTRAQVRYFSTEPPTAWRNSVIPQAFLTRSDALALVKSKLSESSAAAWQELRGVLLSQLDAPWVSETDRKSLANVLAPQ